MLFHLLQRPGKHPCPQQGIVQPRMLMGPRLRKTENRDCDFTSLYLPHSRQHGSFHAACAQKDVQCGRVCCGWKKKSQSFEALNPLFCVYIMPALPWSYIPFLEAPVQLMTILRIRMRTLIKTSIYSMTATVVNLHCCFFIKCVLSGILLFKIFMMLIALFVCSNSFNESYFSSVIEWDD